MKARISLTLILMTVIFISCTRSKTEGEQEDAIVLQPGQAAVCATCEPGVTNTPTATDTPVSPTETPTVTHTPTITPVPPTATWTPLPPTATNTPTATATPTATLQPATCNYIVATNGSNSNPGTLARPFRTIQRGVNALAAGDTLCVRDGTYHEVVIVEIAGTAQDRIVIKSYPGEMAIIDGEDIIPTIDGSYLVWLVGDYITIRDVEIINSNWMGLGLRGKYGQAISVNVHHNREHGIIVTGDYGLVEKSDVWWNSKSNAYGAMERGNWGTGLSAARHPRHATLRNNRVWNNWGEGLSTFEAEWTMLEDNVVWDNWATNVYLSDTKYTIFQRNLIYMTSEWRATAGGSQHGILMGDEQYNPASSDIQVKNNIAWGNQINFYIGGDGPMTDLLVANNTFIDSASSRGNVVFNPGSGSGSRFVNNIVVQNDTVPVVAVIGATGITFYNNLWSKMPQAAAGGRGDVIGNPQFVDPANDDFHLRHNSPAIDAGAIAARVLDDFDGVSRPQGDGYDIGAFEQ